MHEDCNGGFFGTDNAALASSDLNFFLFSKVPCMVFTKIRKLKFSILNGSVSRGLYVIY